VAPDAAAPGACCNGQPLPVGAIGDCHGGPLASLGCDQPGQELFDAALCHPALRCIPDGEDARSRCSAAKAKAAGAFFAGRAKCEAKAAAKGTAVDVVCVGKAQSKVQRAFEKAEKKGDCLATGDLSDAAEEVNETIEVLFQILEPPPSGCCALAGPPRCLWAADQAACEGLAGSFGAPGSVCGGDGACAPPPALEGDCCQTADDACLGGVSSADCSGGGGTFVGDAVCLPGGLCID
jgi:hypothetical protein